MLDATDLGDGECVTFAAVPDHEQPGGGFARQGGAVAFALLHSEQTAHGDAREQLAAHVHHAEQHALAAVRQGVDAARLAESMARVLAELAAVQAPTDVPQQRAIEAVLEEHAEPLFKAIARLALAANALQGSALDTRLSDWRRWVDALREVFVAADEGWGKAQDLVLSTE